MAAPARPVTADRSSAMSGLALAVALAVWWLAGARLALEHGTDAGRGAALALGTLWLVRGITLALLCVRAGALYGWRRGAQSALALIAPSWPLVALAWSASATPLVDVALAELTLLAASVALPSLGVLIRRWLRRDDVAVIVGTGIGAALAAALWIAAGSAYVLLR